MADVVCLGDPFSGSINISSVGVVSISGTWVSTPQSSSQANGSGIVVEGAIGEYVCPYHGITEQVEALSDSNQGGIGGLKTHRVGDSVTCLAGGHTNISVVSTEGQSNTTST